MTEAAAAAKAVPMDTSSESVAADRAPLRYNPKDSTTRCAGVDELHWADAESRAERIQSISRAWDLLARDVSCGTFVFAQDVEHTGPLGAIKSIGICVAHVGESDGTAAAPVIVLLKTRLNIDIGDTKIDEICEREFWRKDGNWETWIKLGDYAVSAEEAARLYRYALDCFYNKFPKKRAVLVNDNPSDDLGRIDALLRQFGLRPTRYSPEYKSAASDTKMTYDYRALVNPFNLLQGTCSIPLRGTLQVDGKTVSLPLFAADQFKVRFQHEFAHSHMPDDDAAHMIEVYALYVAICAAVTRRADQIAAAVSESSETFGAFKQKMDALSAKAKQISSGIKKATDVADSLEMLRRIDQLDGAAATGTLAGTAGAGAGAAAAATTETKVPMATPFNKAPLLAMPDQRPMNPEALAAFRKIHADAYRYEQQRAKLQHLNKSEF